MAKASLLLAVLSFWILKSEAQTVTDIDGNIYNTVTIGSQTWLQENLSTTRFNNGDTIPSTFLSVNNDTNALFQWAYNQDSSIANVYGRLYTWIVASNNRNVCPVGWKIPNNAEWDMLTNFLGGDSVAGGKMKEVGTAHWSKTDTAVTNFSGFTGLGAGFRGNPSVFRQIDTTGIFWSASPFGSGSFPRGFTYRLSADNNAVNSGVAIASFGAAIRCIEDLTTGATQLLPNSEILIYPNPASRKITVSNQENFEGHISIYNLLGVLVLQKPLSDKINHLDVSALPGGNYVTHIVGRGSVSAQKFFKR